jgi:hypothetical protein
MKLGGLAHRVRRIEEAAQNRDLSLGQVRVHLSLATDEELDEMEALIVQIEAEGDFDLVARRRAFGLAFGINERCPGCAECRGFRSDRRELRP